MTNKNKKNFENSIVELEEIIEKLQSGEIGLEESVELYEKGMQIGKYCEKRLKEVEMKIEKIKLQDGLIKKEKFKKD